MNINISNNFTLITFWNDNFWIYCITKYVFLKLASLVYFYFLMWLLENGGGNGNPLHYPCLENPMDRGASRGTVHGVAESRTRLSAHTLENVKWHLAYTFTCISFKLHCIVHLTDFKIKGCLERRARLVYIALAY